MTSYILHTYYVPLLLRILPHLHRQIPTYIRGYVHTYVRKHVRDVRVITESDIAQEGISVFFRPGGECRSRA
jgi:hypothetical protein